MAHLNSCYARSLGVKIGYPVLQPHFFPFLEDKYVTIHTSDKVPSKNYSYWPDVIKILKGEFEKRGIKIIQIGASDDPHIDGVDQFLNNLSFKQSSYIINNALAHVGIDSSPVHIASALDKPTISLISHAYKEICEPIWNKDKAIILESHRNGNKPSFSNFESPKTVDLIQPEEIAESVFKTLKFGISNSQKTLFIGRKYLSKIIDIIPSETPKEINVNDATVRIRMDLCHNVSILRQILQYTSGQVEIITREPLKKEFIDVFKSKISKITYDSSEFDGVFLNTLRESGLAFELNCLDESKLAEQRLKFFHFEIHLCQKEKEARELLEKHKDLPQELKNYSGRFYLIGERLTSTLSQDHKDLQFWIDAKYFRVFVDSLKMLA